jgi:hypothetical protein
MNYLRDFEAEFKGALARESGTSIANVTIFYYRNLPFFCFRLKKNLTNVYFSL